MTQNKLTDPGTQVSFRSARGAAAMVEHLGGPAFAPTLLDLENERRRRRGQSPVRFAGTTCDREVIEFDPMKLVKHSARERWFANRNFGAVPGPVGAHPDDAGVDLRYGALTGSPVRWLVTDASGATRRFRCDTASGKVTELGGVA